MELSERKQKILDAIIRTYLETGEPVGSRTISKYTDLNLSSATIRNEMADLEEMGYIVQPHTSAGRIPSDKGYRLYVDHLMQEKDREVKELKELMIQRTDKMEQVLQQVVLAVLYLVYLGVHIGAQLADIERIMLQTFLEIKVQAYLLQEIMHLEHVLRVIFFQEQEQVLKIFLGFLKDKHSKHKNLHMIMN